MNSKYDYMKASKMIPYCMKEYVGIIAAVSSSF